MSRFAAATARLAAVQQAVAGVPVVFRRGDQAIAVTAIPGKRIDFPYDGSPTSPRGMTWTLPAATLTLDDVPVRPLDGDTITDAGNVYELVPFGEQPPAFGMDGVPSAPVAWRCHTQDVTTNARRDCTVNVKLPNLGAVRSGSGARNRSANDAYTALKENVPARLFLEEPSEDTDQGRLKVTQKVRVNVAATQFDADQLAMIQVRGVSAVLEINTGRFAGQTIWVSSIKRRSDNDAELEFSGKMAA